MCGIVGWLTTDGAPVDVLAATAAIAHRGPDSDGTWSDGRCTLGFRRLSIIDLSAAGCQPMASADGRVQVVFNGEVYNFQALRAELQARGHVFASASDTEVVVNGWIEWGRDVVTHLRGMFAFAVWDGRDRTLFLARDRVGKKPLFFAHGAHRFGFASELQALLTDPTIERRLDPVALDHYLTWGYIPAPRTGFEGVSKLEPGCWMEVREGDGGQLVSRTERYWTLPFTPKSKVTEADAAALVREAVTDAVRARMISDVPLGAFLSGGIDSSIVVAVMASLATDVQTFSIGFEEAAYDELEHARVVANRWGTRHTEEVVRPDALELLPMLVRHYGEPYADSSAIPTFYVSRLARRSVAVALTGDGGDEAFGGYERYWAMRVASRLSQVPGHGLVDRIGRLAPDSGDPKSRTRRVRRFLEAAARPPVERYSRWVGYFDLPERARLYHPDLARQLGDRSEALAWMRSLFERTDATDPAEVAMAVDLMSYLPYDLLVKVDITSMANSLEARAPFLDQELLGVVARLPADMKLRGRGTKHILRTAFADVLPPSIAQRSKMGFGVPIGRWFRGPLRELLLDATLSEQARSRHLFRPEEVERIVQVHLSGAEDHTPRLWALVMLEHWFREFLDAPR